MLALYMYVLFSMFILTGGCDFVSLLYKNWTDVWIYPTLVSVSLVLGGKMKIVEEPNTFG